MFLETSAQNDRHDFVFAVFLLLFVCCEIHFFKCGPKGWWGSLESASESSNSLPLDSQFWRPPWCLVFGIVNYFTIFIVKYFDLNVECVIYMFELFSLCD